jgi:tetratricopeptide (TPR) repeat protein
MLKLERYFDAIRDFDKVIELNPNDVMAYLNRGIVNIGVKQHYAAIKDFNKTIELNPNDALAYLYRGYAYYKAGCPWDLADQDIQTAKRIARIAGDQNLQARITKILQTLKLQ